MESNVSSTLCIDCGLCCDGTLYDRAGVSPGEEERMIASGLELFEERNKRFFHQPCPHSNCGRCMIYQTRFDICHNYECALLKRVKAGELGVAEAKGKIAEAKALLARVVASAPEARSATGRKRARARLADGLRKDLDVEAAAQLLDIIALDTFLKRWFRLPHEDESGDQAAPAGP